MTSHVNGRTFKTIVILAGLLAGLSACRESEEHRQIKLEKGGYAGQHDNQLNEDTLRQLRQRGSLQQN
ncbi:hypothetical protein [Roseibium aestuarii]|uniref:Lipoprotein n=1 Tax=Roseibium aestuarii TaxID=2600299 RepID=A0ABW4JV72_9HYPH|nr:hypothetical protein [Roseibium aestuarii]